MPEKLKTRPNDGGSYRHDSDGSYTRLDTPQKPDPGKSVRRKRAAKAAQTAGTSAAKDSQANTNVRELRKEKE